MLGDAIDQGDMLDGRVVDWGCHEHEPKIRRHRKWERGTERKREIERGRERETERHREIERGRERRRERQRERQRKGDREIDKTERQTRRRNRQDRSNTNGQGGTKTKRGVFYCRRSGNKPLVLASLADVDG